MLWSGMSDDCLILFQHPLFTTRLVILKGNQQVSELLMMTDSLLEPCFCQHKEFLGVGEHSSTSSRATVERCLLLSLVRHRSRAPCLLIQSKESRKGCLACTLSMRRPAGRVGFLINCLSISSSPARPPCRRGLVATVGESRIRGRRPRGRV